MERIESGGATPLVQRGELALLGVLLRSRRAAPSGPRDPRRIMSHSLPILSARATHRCSMLERLLRGPECLLGGSVGARASALVRREH